MLRPLSWVLVAACLGATSASEAAEVGEAPATRINLRERVPLAFLLVSPSGASARVRSSALIELVSEAFERRTDFAPRVVAPERASDCKGRLGCMARVVRSDYDRERLRGPDGRSLPFAVHLERIRDRRSDIPEVLLVLSSLALGDEDRLLPTWVDTDRALEIFHEADRTRPDWEREVEAAVREQAVPVELPFGEVRDEHEARLWVEKLVESALRPELERTGHWEPYGELRIVGIPNGTALLYDERPLGAPADAVVLMTGVPSGAHTLALARGDLPVWAREVSVSPSQLTEVEVTLDIVEPHPLRTGLMWTGVGVGALGLGATAWALAAQPSDTITYCSGSCDDRFLVLGEDTSGVRVGESPSGVLLAPLGASLVLTGATWWLGSLLVGDEEEVPWLAFASGLVLGGAAYGLAAALDPGSPSL